MHGARRWLVIRNRKTANQCPSGKEAHPDRWTNRFSNAFSPLHTNRRATRTLGTYWLFSAAMGYLPQAIDFSPCSGWFGIKGHLGCRIGDVVFAVLIV